MPLEKGNQKSYAWSFPWAPKCILGHLRRCSIFLWSNAALTCCINDAVLSTSSEQTTQPQDSIKKVFILSVQFLITHILRSTILVHLAPYFCVLFHSPLKPTYRISFIPGLRTSLTSGKRASRSNSEMFHRTPLFMIHSLFESQF